MVLFVSIANIDENKMDKKNILKIIETALAGDQSAIQMAVRKFASKIRTEDAELYDQVCKYLSNGNLRSVSKDIKPIPVDMDSRLSLIKIENPVLMNGDPIHSDDITSTFEQLILERKSSEILLQEGLYPSKSIIFQGPPGVGKTMSARWLAKELNLPLLILDLATVMSSYLGKTGSNIRSVIDHAASFPCVLLLDEFDAIAKKRDDDHELGELKRLVTVLLQAVDDWPESSLLIAATNHGELLDPAIWRRFDLEVSFGIPDKEMVKRYLDSYWGDELTNTKSFITEFKGKSFSDINRSLTKAKRKSVLSNTSLRSCALAEDKVMTLSEKKKLAVKMHKQGMSQRSIAIELDISRPTVKKATEQQ
jgi:SpoVK/Ycf46/Vps4 family AAA+-type ATPase